MRTILAITIAITISLGLAACTSLDTPPPDDHGMTWRPATDRDRALTERLLAYLVSTEGERGESVAGPIAPVCSDDGATCCSFAGASWCCCSVNLGCRCYQQP